MAIPDREAYVPRSPFVWDEANSMWVATQGDSQGRVGIKTTGLTGASAAGTVQLTAANTWVAVPDTVPTNPYVLVVSKENEAGTIRWSFDNTGTPSTTNGNQLTTNDIILCLNGGEVAYFGSTDASDDVNWTTKEI